MPLVSVIIPAYNPGHYLDEAVQSAIAQTFTDWECIVVDDGSTEDLSRVEKMDPRVRLAKQENRGVAVARNRGLALSGGQYIALLDADDQWVPEKIAAQVALMDSNADLLECHTGCNMINGDGVATGTFPPASTDSYADMLWRIPPMPSSAMVRRAAFMAAGGFDPCFQGSADFDFFLKIAMIGRLGSIDAPLTCYRIHGGNMSAAYVGMWRDHMAVLDKHGHRAAARRDHATLAAIRLARKRCARRWGEWAVAAALRSDWKREPASTIHHLLRAACWNPRHTAASLAGLLRRDPMDKGSEGTNGVSGP
jgi:glycosyltransferase involved in cell wall biosynthesis